MVMFDTSVEWTPAFAASWVIARFSSSRVMANHRSEGTSLALFMAMRQLVLQGFPTTSTRTSEAALLAIACPCPVKILPLIASRSPRSMPSFRGTLPTRSAQFTSVKPSSRSEVPRTSSKRGKAQSSSSIITPSRAPMAGSISIRFRATG